MTPDYNVGGQWVSDLGVREGASYFNSGVVVAGALAIPLALSLGAVLRPQLLGIIGSAFLALSGIALMGVGIFTEDAGDLHLAFSVAFFLLVFTTAILLILPLHQSQAMRPWTAPLTLVVVIIGIIMGALYGFGPLTETVVVLIVAIWIFLISFRLRWYLCVHLREYETN